MLEFNKQSTLEGRKHENGLISSKQSVGLQWTKASAVEGVISYM